ncbi:sensor histidine kinase [Bordetella sp. 02P26C-1]|uniref:sensor histidine kinase n=1 Tax=Bordetella sp. 02P26C-1 TaxID=2683195 RepID=UPI001354BE05|nr:sensor histidine kinase [Bordetella sp. 02P26C-1]MVW79142.1 sensor histidine kinase [Bordetella sp. 02P26C-1]
MGIRTLLITLLLPGIILLLVIDSWNDYRTLSAITNEAYDSALLEPARVLESSIEFTPDGQLLVTTPVYAQVILESKAGLRKYFRIEEVIPPQPEGSDVVPPSGRTLAGMPELPRPPVWPSARGEPLFFNSVYRDDPVRVVAILRDLYYRGQHRQVLVLVAESIGRRLHAEETAQRQELLRDARMLALVAILVWWGVTWSLRPLNRLRNDIRSRSPADMTPLDASRVPSEVIPLVDAVNYHIERHRRVLDEQAQFLADASHQLRTPLAIILTQAQYALREPDPQRAREGLQAIVEQLGRTRRLTEQLLSLAHASQGEAQPRELLDLNEVARNVVLQYLPLSHEKRQDLGWVSAETTSADELHLLAPRSSDDADQTIGASSGGDPRAPLETRPTLPVFGSEAEIHEALSNLLHNAIHYAPVGARITVSGRMVGDRAEVAISDNGPGIDVSARIRAFARFDRLGSGRSSVSSGSGLGLAIARAYARRNAGDIVLRDGEPNAQGGLGLCAVLWLPMALPTGVGAGATAGQKTPLPGSDFSSMT